MYSTVIQNKVLLSFQLWQSLCSQRVERRQGGSGGEEGAGRRQKGGGGRGEEAAGRQACKRAVKIGNLPPFKREKNGDEMS